MAENSRDDKGRFSGHHPDKKFSWGRSRKRPRQFFGKRSTDASSPENKKARLSTSAKKINKLTSPSPCDTKNRIVDISILFKELEKIVCCKVCHNNLHFSESESQGLAFKIGVTCEKCSVSSAISSSKKVGPKSNASEVNRRSVLALRALGHGHAGLSTLCGIMDFQKPVAKSAFDSINNQLSAVCEEVAQDSMLLAVEEEKQLTNSNQLNVSGDGSWRKRGFSSLQGLASIIGNQTGKVLDVAIKNSFCKTCDKWAGKEETVQYKEWYENHEPQCSANHEGSAGKMEVDGICEIFQRSEDKYDVLYKNYIGDGDSKVFKAVTEAQPYGSRLTISKKECISHVQKRMGTRLRNLKKSLTGQTLSDGKGIGGAGRLTAQLIDRLSSYYGKAIRDHSDSVEDMSNAIWATFYHQRSTDQNPQHHLCPKGASSWCKWQKAKACKNKTFKHQSSIPSAIMDKLKPIYTDLTEPQLLERCIGGFTQNNNESFNNCVWKLVPKTSFSGLTVLKIGVYTAVVCFNSGCSGYLKIMKKFEINPGIAAIAWTQTSDDCRLFHAERKALASTKEARTSRRTTRGEVQDDAYAAGAH